MSEKVFKSLDATIEAGSIDLLVEVVEGGPSVFANLVITSEEDVEKEPPTFDLNRKDVVAIGRLMRQTLDAMSVAAPEPDIVYDALRLLILSSELRDDITRDIHVWMTDLYERGMLKLDAESDPDHAVHKVTFKGRTLIEQAFRQARGEYTDDE